MQAAKEKASNMTASAKAGMEKTKATVEEKAERMTTRDPIKKDMATQKKEERMDAAERQKQMAYDENAAARHGESWAGHAGGYTTTGTGGYTTAGTGGGYTTGGTTGHHTGGAGGYTTTGGTTGHHHTGGAGGYTTGGTTGGYTTGTQGTNTGYGTEDPLGTQYPHETTTRAGAPNGRGGARTGYGSGSTY